MFEPEVRVSVQRRVFRWTGPFWKVYMMGVRSVSLEESKGGDWSGWGVSYLRDSGSHIPMNVGLEREGYIGIREFSDLEGWGC